MPPSEEPPIAVVGAGAIGCMLGAHLAAAGHRVVMVDVVEPRLQAIERDGIRVTGVTEVQARVARTCLGVSGLAGSEVGLVFVAVKAPVLPVLAPGLAAACPERAVVVSFQNGMDTEVVLASAFGAHRTLRTVVNFAGGMVGDAGASMSFFNRPNHLGAVHPDGEPEARRVAELLTACGLETVFTPAIRRYVWEKVILNAGLSPLCALTHQLMREAMTLPATRELVRAILEEGIAVARADGVDPPEGYLDFCLGYLDRAGMHKPSMLVDVEAGRRTEIDYITVPIVEYGRRYGVPTPVNATIASLVRGIDSRVRVGQG